VEGLETSVAMAAAWRAAVPSAGSSTVAKRSAREALACRRRRTESIGRPAAPTQRPLRTVAPRKHWQEPDASLWELDDDWWTHSRLSCVDGLRAASAVAPPTEADTFLALADASSEETTRRCLNPRGYWQRAPNRSGPDAALLLPPVRAATAADDARTRATLEVVRRQLCEDGYVDRFPQDPHPLGDEEGAFLLCGFIMALADHDQGNRVEAFRRFERHRASRWPPGFFAEEYDVTQRQLRGNLP
jgi:GH15 family glucan-1,4-alpha-glucosidase